MPNVIDFLTQETPDGSLSMYLGGVITNIPHIPSRIGELGLFESAGLMGTNTLAFDQDGYNLTLVPHSDRGTDVTLSTGPDAGDTVYFKADRLEREIRIMSDDVLNLRALGTAGDIQGAEAWVQRRLTPRVQEIRATREWRRLGALRGLVLNHDATATRIDLYTKLGVSAPAPVYFDLGATSPEPGAIRKACAGVVRRIATALGGLPFSGIHAFVGSEGMDLLQNHPETREVFLRQAQTPLANGTAYTTFTYAGITFEEYRGQVGPIQFVADDEFCFFPLGVPGMFQEWFAPGDRDFLAGTVGLPEYAFAYVDPKGRFREIAVQSNPVTVCTRPGALIGGFAGADPAP